MTNNIPNKNRTGEGLQHLSAEDLFRLAMSRSGKSVQQIGVEMGWGNGFANRVCSPGKFYPSFCDIPKFNNIVGNTHTILWLQERTLAYGFAHSNASVDCTELVKRIAELYQEMGEVGIEGNAAVRDNLLEPHEIRKVINELDDVACKTMDLMSDLRALERSIVKGERA